MNAETPSIASENVEAEAAVIGTLMMHNAAYDEVARILEPGHFSEPLHQLLFQVMGDLLKAGKAAIPTTIMNYVPNQDMGGLTVKQYLGKILLITLPLSALIGLSREVHDQYLRRVAYTECDMFARKIADLPADSDILDEIGALEEKLSQIRAKRVTGQSGANAGTRYLEKMSAAFKSKEIVGVPIFMKEVQDVISEPCFEAGNLYGLLSSSGEGKTSLTLQIVYHAVKAGHPVQFLSFDQTEDQCIRQMVAQVEGITASRQRRGDLKEPEWFAAQRFAEWVDRQPIEFVDLTDETAVRIKSLARPFLRRHANGKTPLIVVDHIGQVTPENARADEGTKAKQINGIFKSAAKETGSAWLVLNQRNTYGMRRDNPRPIASDLYGGEGARQAYDAVFYVYRFKKHYEERAAVAASDSDWKKINKVFPEAVRNDEQDLTEIGAVKVRFGSPSIKRQVEFEPHLTRYRSLKTNEQPELLP